ncbi:hypothetical protein [Streptomyces sp. G45]|uniref:hypothetical protein n=1 Tax=Streptomyces sp. G45 TaxID=3406627 RepID=UPI003C1C9730
MDRGQGRRGRQPGENAADRRRREGGKFSADIRLHDERQYGDAPSFLEVTVVSGCFRRA